jgi:hypothetical protein
MASIVALVGQLPVLDGAHARLEAAHDPRRRVDMGADIGPPVGRRLDRGAHLVERVLRGVERVVERGDAAAGHDLDLAGAPHQLLARAPQHLGPPVGQRGHARGLAVARRVARHPRQLAQQPEVAVARGLREHGARGEDARPRDGALVDRHLQPEGRPACVAHGGEPAHQRGARLAAGHEVDPAHVLRHGGDLADGDQRRVPVAVDQPGDHRAAAALHDLGLPGPLPRGGEARDAAVGHEDVDALAHRLRTAVEEAKVTQEHRPAGRLRARPPRGEAEPREHPDHRGRAAQHLAAGQVRIDPPHRRLRGRRAAQARVDGGHARSRRLGAAQAHGAGLRGAGAEAGRPARKRGGIGGRTGIGLMGIS